MEVKNGACSRCTNTDVPLVNKRLKIGVCCYDKYLRARKEKRLFAKTPKQTPFKLPWRSKKPQKPIPKMGKKLKRETAEYHKVRLVFLNKTENKQCKVYNHMKSTEVHHLKGRQGFADKESRDQGLRLLIDPRYFLGVSREGHKKIEENREWAMEKGFILSRTNVIWK